LNRVQILNDVVANQVAAGEVIERPASVVKELVENSLDAGAGAIRVDFSRAGAAWIRVADDGCGMTRDDALLCLERHATSKIRHAADLAAVRSFGFRGEALPSIASVSRFRLATRQPSSVEGVEIQIDGGKITAVRACGEPAGTVIEVRSLFFNVPARRKFLRAETTEAVHIFQWMQTFSLAHPRVGFRVFREGREILSTPSAADPAVRVREVLGDSIFRTLNWVDSGSDGGIRVHGFVGRAGEGRGDRSLQFVFVNGRPVRDATVQRALAEGFHRALPAGRHPIAVLFLEMDPGEVDCNVHPAKREVRFHQPLVVRDVVTSAVANALRVVPSASPVVPKMLPASFAFLPEEPRDLVEMAPPPVVQKAAPIPAVPQDDDSPAEAEPPSRSPDFQYRGPFGSRYALLESPGGLVILDVRAASERVWFETLLRGIRDGGVEAQQLLFPQVVEVAARDADWIARNEPLLVRSGIRLEPFGAKSWKVESLPAIVAGQSAADVLADIVQALRDAGGGARHRMIEDALARAVCSRVAVAGSPGREEDVRRVLGALFACALPYACPKGRPTLIEIGHGEMERKFGRSV